MNENKILIFSTAYLPLIGGAEIAVKEITDRLGSSFSFDLICARIKNHLPEKEKIGQVEVYRLGSGRGIIDKLLLPWRGSRLAKKLHAQKKYNAIWAVMASYGGLAALFFKKKFPDIPYLLTLQEGDTPEHIHSRAKWLGRYYRKIFQKADFITAISHYLKDYGAAQGAKCPIEVVPNGVDLQKFKIQNSKFKNSIQNLKNKLNIKEGEKVIITVSRLVEKNGIGDLIEAIAQYPISNIQYPIKLVIIGAGPLEESLKFKVQSLKLEDKVLFLGNVPNEEVPQYLAISDLFVRPSLAEGLGNSFLEAMVASVPIIGTNVGGIPDFLRDGETGLFCEVRNPKSISERIKLLLQDDELQKKLIVNGQRLVEENYDWDLIARKMGNIFNKLCAS